MSGRSNAFADRWAFFQHRLCVAGTHGLDRRRWGEAQSRFVGGFWMGTASPCRMPCWKSGKPMPMAGTRIRKMRRTNGRGQVFRIWPGVSER